MNIRKNKTIIFIILLIVLVGLQYKINKNLIKIEKFSDQIYQQAYYITVDRFTDRQQYMENEFKKNGLQVKKYLGQDKKKLDKNRLQELQNLTWISTGVDLSTLFYNGSIACLLSHTSLWDKLQGEKGEVFLIFEDDCQLESNFNSKLNSIYSYFPQDWDMIWLAHNNLKGKKINSKVLIPENKAGWGYNAQHHCYLIKKKSIPKLLSVVLPITSPQPKDVKIRNNFDKFKAYFYTGNLAHQDRKNIPKSERESLN